MQLLIYQLKKQTLLMLALYMPAEGEGLRRSRDVLCSCVHRLQLRAPVQYTRTHTRARVRATCLQCKMLRPQRGGRLIAPRSLVHLPFDGVAGYQAVDFHHVFLPGPIKPADRLRLPCTHLVPVLGVQRVHKDDVVRNLQVCAGRLRVHRAQQQPFLRLHVLKLAQNVPDLFRVALQRQEFDPEFFERLLEHNPEAVSGRERTVRCS